MHLSRLSETALFSKNFVWIPSAQTKEGIRQAESKVTHCGILYCKLQLLTPCIYAVEQTYASSLNIRKMAKKLPEFYENLRLTFVYYPDQQMHKIYIYIYIYIILYKYIY